MSSYLLGLVALTVVLLGCGIVGQGDEEVPQSTPTTEILYHYLPVEGERSIEERILRSGTIVKGRLNSKKLKVVKGDSHWSEYYFILQTFEVDVIEYLYGSGGGTLKAVVEMGGSYDSAVEATAALAEVGGRRNTRWDDREAIFLLEDDDNEVHKGYFERRSPDTRYFASEMVTGGWDFYSFESCFNQLWLPAVDTSIGMGDNQRFQLRAWSWYVDCVVEMGPDWVMPERATISLGELKRMIADLNAEVAKSGDCVLSRYVDKRIAMYLGKEEGKYGFWDGSCAL